jgi:acyl-CoA synthetase (AMP-forming)/AMP-acid ligase II
MAFHVPELYGPSALGLDGLVDYHFYNNPEYPFARLTPRHHGQSATVSWREMAEAVHRAGHAFQDSIGSLHDVSQPPVVAVLAPDDGLVYTALQLAIIRIGFIVSYQLI